MLYKYLLVKNSTKIGKIIFLIFFYILNVKIKNKNIFYIKFYYKNDILRIYKTLPNYKIPYLKLSKAM